MNWSRVKRVTVVLAAALALTASAAREDRWRGIGPGGGGALFHPTVSPHDPRTALIACDMTGSYITTDAGGRWRIFNLGGAVEFFHFDPIDPRVIYAKAGALFRSTDGGTTWARFFPSAVAKITMGDDHAGHTFHLASGPLGDIGAMAIDAADSRALYLALDSTLWTSSDGGATWRAADLPGRARRMWIDAGSSRADRTLYVAGRDAIYRRQDGVWRTGASPGVFTDVTGTPPRFYATSAGKIFVSRDGGMTWSTSSLPGFGGRAAAIAASPQQPDVAYVSYSDLRAPIRATRGVAKTVDGGRRWIRVWHNVRDAWLTERFNAEWVSNPLGLGVAPGTPDVVYATDYGRTLRTSDGGASWQAVYSTRAPDGGWTTNGVDVTTSYGVHFDPFDPRHMFIGYTDIGLFASDNGGASWYSATRSGVPESWVNTTYWMAFDPDVRGRMWAAMSGVHDLPRPKMWRGGRSPEGYDGGVVRSDDGGRTWRVQNAGMPETAATHILRDPGGTLYVTGFGRGVFKSTDGGERWTLKNAGIEGAHPLAWRLARDSRATLYVVVARRSDDGSFGNTGDGAIYRSTDGAEHWTRMRLPPGVNGPNGLAIDPRDPGRLYLAAWGRSTPRGAEDGGVYLSTDAGATWRRVLTQDQHVYDVTVDPHDPRVLYAAGFEASAWRSSDRGLTWRRIPGFDFKWAHRVIVDPREPGRIFITTFGGSVWYGKAD